MWWRLVGSAIEAMIEEHIDYYTEDKDWNRRAVHLPTPFVRHFMRRHDGVLPTVVAVATAKHVKLRVYGVYTITTP